MGEIKNTQGASAEADRALASDEAPVGSSSLQDGDPSRWKWLPIATAPRDGTKVLLRFDPPFSDSLEDGVVTGLSTGAGWWLSSIWASTISHKEPVKWMPLPPAPGMEAEGRDAPAAWGEARQPDGEAGAPQPPSSTPGEAERLVDALVDAAIRDGRMQALGPVYTGSTALALFEARTALLSYIITAGRGEGAGPIRDRDGRPANYAAGDAAMQAGGRA